MRKYCDIYTPFPGKLKKEADSMTMRVMWISAQLGPLHL
jgi:hypothetical protein